MFIDLFTRVETCQVVPKDVLFCLTVAVQNAEICVCMSQQCYTFKAVLSCQQGAAGQFTVESTKAKGISYVLE